MSALPCSSSPLPLRIKSRNKKKNVYVCGDVNICACVICVCICRHILEPCLCLLSLSSYYISTLLSVGTVIFFFEKQNLDINNLLGEQGTRSKTQPSIIDLT